MQIQPITGLAQYVSAGHNQPLHYSAASGSTTPLLRTGMPLGIETDIAYEQREITLQRGDFVFFYTDGVTDATNERQQMYGEERMNEVIHAYRHSNATSMVAGLVRSLQAFTGGATPFDDITILVARRL
jgi:sigma-B regulation protein RsbU (phosphoserine phosphatase)